LNRTMTNLFNVRPSTNIFGRWGWRWWQDIDKPNNDINTCIICI